MFFDFFFFNVYVFVCFFLKCSCCIMCQFLLYSKVNQPYVYMYFPLPWISFPFRSPQSIKQSSFCYTVGSHQLSILYIVMYVCQSQSPSPSHPTFLPWYVSISALQISSSMPFFLDSRFCVNIKCCFYLSDRVMWRCLSTSLLAKPVGRMKNLRHCFSLHVPLTFFPLFSRKITKFAAVDSFFPSNIQ